MNSRWGKIYYCLVVFAVACATLILQIIQTRIYAFVFWNHLVYFIVSIALLGFGISGTWLAFGKATWLARRLSIEIAAIGFVFTALVSTLLVPQIRFSIENVLSSQWHLLRLILTYSTAVFPYFFSGWILGVIYRERADDIHSLYFLDLLGAGTGCLLVLGLITPIGAVGLVQVTCLLVAVPILAGHWFSARKAGSVGFLVAITVVCGTLFEARHQIDRHIFPDDSKAFSIKLADVKEGPSIELTEWNSIARTDIVGSKADREKRIFIDGDAWTDMATGSTPPGTPPPPFDPGTESYLPQRAPFVLGRAVDEILVLGSGGGRNVWSSLRAGAKHVDAVEINPTTARILLNDYRETTHSLFLRPEVTLWNEEGRSFLRRQTKLYDVIMMNAIDTFAALDAGAYMLAENYLYTLDAVVDYVKHLKPNGVLNITRWDYAGETPRLFATMLEALYVLGYQEPGRHVFAASRDGWTAVVVSPAPFTTGEIAAVQQQAVKWDGTFYFPLAAAVRQKPFQVDLNAYAEARATDRQQEFYDSYYYNIRPVTDDSPFFFHYEKLKNVLKVLVEKSQMHYIRGHWPSFTLYLLTGLLTLALLVFVFLPLLRHTRGGLPQFGQWLAYFCCLGFAFIFVEISMMQRFALLLGHPARSLALVLAALLVFAGAGSYCNEKLRIRVDMALVLLLVCLLAAAFIYPEITFVSLGLPLWARGTLTVLLVLPPAFLMGMPFPAGIKKVSHEASDAVPWMLGVNGGATVLGSILAVMCAISFNFTTVIILATCGYAVAVVLSRTLKVAQ